MRKSPATPKRVRRTRKKRPWTPVETEEAVDDGDDMLSDKEPIIGGPPREPAKADGAE